MEAAIMEELQMALKRAFATTYAFLVKAENFHWNVVGANFQQHHELFGDIYDEVDDEDGSKMRICYFPTNEQKILFKVISKFDSFDSFLDRTSDYFTE